MKKKFSVWLASSKKLKRKNEMVILLDFERNSINIHKLEKGRELRKRFLFTDCASLEQYQTNATVLTIGFQNESSKMTFIFQSREQRELFVQLVRAAMIAGVLAWSKFKELDVENTGTLSWETLQHVGFATPDSPAYDEIDFCKFLLLLSQARSKHTPHTPSVSLSSVGMRSTSASNAGMTALGHMLSSKVKLSLSRLDGEAIMTEQQHAVRADVAVTPESPIARGVLFLTNYRIVYNDYHMPTYNADIPLGNLSRLSLSSDGLSITLHTKDYLAIVLRFDRDARWVQGLMDHIKIVAFTGNQTKTFAFEHKLKLPENDKLNGWAIYNDVEHYERCLNLCNSPQLRSVDNSQFKISPTYPPVFVIPKCITDKELEEICEYRSRARVPAVVWMHPVHKSTLARCAQPLVGLRNKRSEADEKIIAALRTSNPSNSNVLYIIDARPYKAAMGNTVMGKGFEDVARYDKCVLQFMKIDNIHCIRNSMEKVVELCQQAAAGTVDENTWLGQLAQTQWLHYIRLVLSAGALIASMLEDEKASVVTHCSDGWDRTAQLSALAQLMLDPYFRTMEGFVVLLEKEWLWFGHKFAERYGHMCANFTNDQRAPIFTQFIDTVWQLLRQFPLAFQFNEAFLLDLLHHVVSCRFGTFLYETERERVENKVRQRTPSLWTYLLAKHNRTRYHNTLYSPQLTNGRLIPNVGGKCIVLWEGYFLKNDSAVSKQPQLTNLVGQHLMSFQKKYMTLRRACKDKGYDLNELDPNNSADVSTALTDITLYTTTELGLAKEDEGEKEKDVHGRAINSVPKGTSPGGSTS